jgi:subtilisin family serine protease
LSRSIRSFVAALAFASGFAALAQPVPTAELDRLSAKAASPGGVRVIIGMDVASEPEGRLSRPKARMQREQFRAARDAAMAELLNGTSARVHHHFEATPHTVADVDANAMARLKYSRRIRSIQEDVAVPHALLESTALVNAPKPWVSGRKGTDWVVAVLDTGVDKNHPFLAGKVVSEACYSSNSSQSSSLCPGGASESTAVGSGLNCNTAISGCTHGTHVAGIVAGRGAPDGSQGVAPDAKLIAVQVFSHFPAQGGVMSYTSDQIKGLERVYALRDTYRIAAVNMSLGGGQYSSICDSTQPALKAAIDNLRSAGIATVIASGNNSYTGSISAPACISSAVSVGAHCDAGPDGSACATGVGGMASYSNTASFLSLVAPGSYIKSSVPGSGYASFNGTSMAAPHVAGAWAIMKQAEPAITVDEALARFRAQGWMLNDTRPGGNVTGMKRVNLEFLAGDLFELTVFKPGTGSGTVASAPAGIQCGTDCSQSYAEGASVTLNATPAAGSTFTGWGGACSGAGVCTVSMTQARSVVANFKATPYVLTFTKAGTGAGAVVSSPAGLNCTSNCSAALDGGTVLTLTAVPATGSRFAGWTGACTGTAACKLTMTAARAVGANFTALTYPVTVTKAGTGSGSVVSSPTGISCGTTCSVARAHGSAWTLTATAANGSIFAGWSGACTGTGPCSGTVGGAVNVTATFRKTHNTLSVLRTGTGTGSVVSAPAGINCGTVCSTAITAESTVTLTPAAAAGSTFTGWTGACTGTGACRVSMDAARAVTASFARITYALGVSVSGSGIGTVVSLPAGISCGTACSKPFNSGTSVTLTATAGSGSVFSGWSGACSGTGRCTVTLDDAKQTAAVFIRTHQPLSLVKAGTGSGSVVSNPAGLSCSATCSKLLPLNAALTLTATPAAESVFTGWTGACSGTGTCEVSMAQARSVTATFTRTRYTLTTLVTGAPGGRIQSSSSGIDCGSACTGSMALNSVVSLTPIPATGWRFTGWFGACTGTGACTVTLNAAKSVEARFAPLSYVLKITKAGTGAGNVVSAPAGLSCGTTCMKGYTHGSVVTLTAKASTGSTFGGWSGGCSGTAYTCSVSVTRTDTVTATFNKP